jgi:hypothetical protein
MRSISGSVAGCGISKLWRQVGAIQARNISRSRHAHSTYSNTCGGGVQEESILFIMHLLCNRMNISRRVPMKNIPLLLSFSLFLFTTSAVRSLSAEPLDNWHPRHPSNYYGVAYGNGIFVAVGSSGIIASSDGSRWVERDAGISKQDLTLRSVACGNGRFVVVGNIYSGSDPNLNTSVILISDDGITWTQVNLQIGFELL